MRFGEFGFGESGGHPVITKVSFYFYIIVFVNNIKLARPMQLVAQLSN